MYIYICEYIIRNRDWNHNGPSTVVSVSPLQPKMSGQNSCYILSGDHHLTCNFQTVLAWGTEHHLAQLPNTRNEHEQASLKSRRTASSHSYQEQTRWYGLLKASWNNVTIVKLKMTTTMHGKNKNELDLPKDSLPKNLIWFIVDHHVPTIPFRSPRFSTNSFFHFVVYISS